MKKLALFIIVALLISSVDYVYSDLSRKTAHTSDVPQGARENM